MSQRHGDDARAQLDGRLAPRCSGLRLAITMSAPSRANSVAMARPRPVPPPVTNTAVPANVPAGSALVPAGAGSGKPGWGWRSSVVKAQLPV
jgi:hypothetical protein